MIKVEFRDHLKNEAEPEKPMSREKLKLRNMKKGLFFTLIALSVFISSKSYSQNNKGLGRVVVLQGKEVYVMCEPERAYEVVDKVNSSVMQLLDVSPTLTNMVNTLVDKAVNKEKKGKVKPFDAIITSDGNNAILVKFKDGNTDKKGIGRINIRQGKEVYVMCEPLAAYTTVDKINTAAAQIIGVSPTIENMVKIMVDKSVNKEQNASIGKFDAIITSDGDNAILVKFN